MSVELPKRLFKAGEETQVTQINNNCKMVCYMKRLEQWLPKELKEVKKDRVFAPIFKLHENGLGYSARVIHSFLCRELVTYKMHELWFVFARRPLRFSLLEFHAVTGLQCDTSLSRKELVGWDDDGGFWSTLMRRKQGISMLELWNNHSEAVKKWSNADRIRLVYLCIIVCMVCGRDDKANIPYKYIKLVINLENLRNYPWGVASFDLLCESIAKNRDTLKEKTTSYVLDGFSYALEIWAMEAVPKIGKLCGKKLSKEFMNGPRCVNWMGAAKLSYEELIRLENIFTPEDVTYPYISWSGNYVELDNPDFIREDEVVDDRVRQLSRMILTNHDFSDHIWEFEEIPEFCFGLLDKGKADEVAKNDEEAKNDEVAGSGKEAASDEDFRTPRGSASIASTVRKGKKRLPDRGMEKRKQKVLSSTPQQAPFNEAMKAFVAQLFEQNFAGMEERLQKQMGERFEKMQSELKGSFKGAGVEVEHAEPSPSKPSPTKPSPTKPSPTKPSPTKPSPRRSKRLDMNFSEEDDIDEVIGTQGVEGLSQSSFVPGFDPSQTNFDNEPRDWWTPMTTVRKLPRIEPTQENTGPPPTKWERWSKGANKKLQLSDSPMTDDGSPRSSLYYFSEEAWNRFTEWSMNPTPLRIGPTAFNLTVAQRIICAGKWLGNEEMDAMMYIWRENTNLRRWKHKRIASMTSIFCLQLENEYQKFWPNKKGYEMPEFLLAYGRGALPSHGRTNKVWGVDVDRLYCPLFVNGNHWVAVCVNIVEKKVEVYDCQQGKMRQYVEKFAAMVPRIVKEVGPPESKKQRLLSSYSIVDMPLKSRLNKSCSDCGAYALKHLECLLLDHDLNLVDDEIIPGCRQKIALDIWEAAHDPILIKLMAAHVPLEGETSDVFNIEED